MTIDESGTRHPPNAEAGDNPVTTDEYFGGCPHCGKTDGYFNVRREHYFVCHKHRVLWCVGSNLFGSWREETQETWDANIRRFQAYEEVQPVQPTKQWESFEAIEVKQIPPVGQLKEG